MAQLASASIPLDELYRTYLERNGREQEADNLYIKLEENKITTDDIINLINKEFK